MLAPQTSSIHVASSVADALSALANDGADVEVMAGATWIMRAPLRLEPQPKSYVAISRVAELKSLDLSNHELSIGACVTHAQLAAAAETIPEWRCLTLAAGKSANPAIRSVATVGGNLAARDFAAADLVPALLCLDAEVLWDGAAGTKRITLADYLKSRRIAGNPGMITRIMVPRRPLRSAHARLPLRKAGDYPVAIVSAAATVGINGIINDVSVAVGAVETVARRWPQLEESIVGRKIDPIAIGETAKTLAHEFDGRNGVEAPGWYRVSVLPTLVRRAFEALQQQ